MNATVFSASSSSSVLPPAGSVKKEEDKVEEEPPRLVVVSSSSSAITATATISMLGLKKEEEKKVKKEEDEDGRDDNFRTRCFDPNNTTKKKLNIPSTMVPDQVNSISSSSSSISSSSSNSSSHSSVTENHKSILGNNGDDNDGTNHRRFEKWESGNWCWLDDNQNNDVKKEEEGKEEKLDNDNGVKNEEEEDNDNDCDTNNSKNGVDNNEIKKEEENVDDASSVNATKKNKNNGNRLEEATIPDDNIESTTNDPNDWTTGDWCWEARSNSTIKVGRAASATTSVAVSTGTTNRMEEATIPFDKIRSDNNNDQDDWTTGNWCWEERPNPIIIPGRMKKRKLEQSGNNDTKKPRSMNIIQNNTNSSNTTNSNDDSNSDRLLDDDDADDYSGVDEGDDYGDDDYDDSNGDEREKRWKKMYGRLLKYKQKYKSTFVPNTFEDDRRLGRWVVKQRNIYNNNKLSQDRINQLNSISFVWNARDTKWTEMYEKLLAYKNQYVSTTVPRTFDDDRSLGRWVNQQRCCYSNNKLSEDRINQLNSISFVWNVYDTKWTEMYARLVAYKNQYKSTSVPFTFEVDGQRLGRWVNQQRNLYNNNKLSEDQINQLNSIGFFWNEQKLHWTKMYERLDVYKKEHKSTSIPPLNNKDSSSIHRR